MAQTVVGIFNDSNAAQNAAQRLTAYGFSQSDIDITNQSDVNQRGQNADSSERSADDFGDRVSRFFKNLFDDDSDVERYSTLARTETVVSVYADSREEAERAADILDEYGAINVNEKGTAYGAATTNTGTDRYFSATESDDDLNENEKSNRSIPVIEEEIQVGKREVQTGGMRLRSRIIERPVEESLRLRSEHVHLERNPVNRPATDSDLDTFREGEIEIRERAEVPVVNKEARVVEEINVRKDVEEREEVVRDTVRKTELEIEKLDQDTDLSDKKSKSKRKI